MLTITGNSMGIFTPAPSAASGAPLFSRLQWQAIRIGLREGERALAHARWLGFTRLFTRAWTRPLADDRLEALRSYAEIARVMTARGRAVPTGTLSAAGFSDRQIAALGRVAADRSEDA